MEQYILSRFITCPTKMLLHHDENMPPDDYPHEYMCRLCTFPKFPMDEMNQQKMVLLLV